MSLKSFDKPTITGVTENRGLHTLDTDTCAKQIGFVVLKEQEERSKRPALYWYRKRNDKEQKLTITHKECQASVWLVILFRP